MLRDFIQSLKRPGPGNLTELGKLLTTSVIVALSNSLTAAQKQTVQNSILPITSVAAINLPSIAAAATGSVAVTIAGVEVGDVVIPSGVIADGIAVISCVVTGANTATIKAVNVTAAPIDAAAVTLLFIVIKKTAA